MQTPTPITLADRRDPRPAAARTQPTTLVAVEAVLLWPRGMAAPGTTTGEAGLWPVFAVVLGERVAPVAPGARPLFDLLDAPAHADRIAVVDSRCRWSVLDARRALLKLAVCASAPVRFDVDIVLPARSVLGVLARGATVAVTTQRRATTFTDHVDIGDALHELVLLGRAPPVDLAVLGRTRRRAHTDGRPGHQLNSVDQPGVHQRRASRCASELRDG